ncbi:TetR/AcrR family transcriptional regulator [Gluconacetobacter asukensis]|uniref:TetR/AcrR family transcriptional regulator n=1 Tax=Gluconacetobacter asukensis TaxID=1017181 RepID=A0A7W4J3B4_9PROT|nr:TetR/AcrR family transcriptional regulator [Gluconacetobacter asukensis]MBB2173678.1 TetR/AcrR family transcriptional regulator [Gluconacetobacter asukensis]
MAAENRSASSKQKRRRLDPEDREREIIDGAVAFFAEVGFDGGLRDLAKRLGITHQNLFRYFPTKEVLIDRVYEEVYLGRWQVEWEVLLADRTIALEQRLMQFYRSYLQAIFRYDWVRIFVFAGLKGVGITQRYLELVQARVVEPLARELRAATGLPDTSEVPLLPEETELAWGLHGELFYLAVRRWVYEMKVPDDLDMVVRVAVVKFLSGAPSAMRLLHEGTLRTPAPQPGRRARPVRRNPR